MFSNVAGHWNHLTVTNRKPLVLGAHEEILIHGAWTFTKLPGDADVRSELRPSADRASASPSPAPFLRGASSRPRYLLPGPLSVEDTMCFQHDPFFVHRKHSACAAQTDPGCLLPANQHPGTMSCSPRSASPMSPPSRWPQDCRLWSSFHRISARNGQRRWPRDPGRKWGAWGLASQLLLLSG